MRGLGANCRRVEGSMIDALRTAVAAAKLGAAGDFGR